MKLFCLLCITVLYCLAENIVIDKNFSTTLSIGKQHVFEETQTPLSVQEILERTDQGVSKLTTPSTKAVHWIMFKLQNTSTQAQQILLKHPRAGLDFIDLYIFKESELYLKSELGDLRPHDNRAIIHQNSVEILMLEPETTYTVISRLQSYGPYELWWSIESTSYFTLSTSLKTVIWGILGGILVALMIYNFVLYFLFRQISYMIYCGYAVCLLLFHYSYEGLLYEFFANINLKLLTIGSWVWVYLTLFFLFLFPYFFFKLHKEWLGKLLLIFASFALGCALMYMCAFFNMNLLYFTRYTTPISLGLTLYLIIFSFIILIQKRPGSLYFAVARIIFTVCAIYDTLIVGGYIQQAPFSWLVLPLGIIIDLVFLSLALGEKIKIIQKENKMNEELLIAQSRFIAIGQTVGNITHQWKTPIAQLASQFMFLQATFIHRKDLFLNEFAKKIPQILQSIDYVQESIMLFSNFYKHSNAKTLFNPVEEITAIQTILEEKLLLHDIDINVVSNINSLYTHKNALMNILMILLENAIEALRTKPSGKRFIEVQFNQQDKHISIIVKDNAGEVTQEIFNNLFSFAYSSKENNFGLGLTIVKTLVEKKLKGSIRSINALEGLSFIISLIDAPE